MKERPVIFSGPMVRAILNGRKTQTRRIVSPAPTRKFYCWPRPGVALFADGDPVVDYPDDCDEITCPHGAPGDRLWIREGFALAPLCEDPDSDDQDDWSVVYRADGDERPWRSSLEEDTLDVKPPWRSPIFMPRWASRITLEVIAVRVQRLQEISEDDARAEGVELYTPPHGHISPEQRVPGPGFDRARLGDQPHRLPFADAWDRVNGKRAPWESNPWVWALTFKRLDGEA